MAIGKATSGRIVIGETTVDETSSRRIDMVPKNAHLFCSSIYIKVTVCTYVPMSPFHARTGGPISTKFCTDLPTNSGKVLNTSMTPQTLPLDPGVPQTSKPKWVMGEKTLCNVSSSNFSRAAPGPGWLVYYKSKICDWRTLDSLSD